VIRERNSGPLKKIDREKMNPSRERALPDQIRLERYRYILDRKKSLNENTFKIVSFFQAIALVIGTAQFAVVDRLSAGSLILNLAKTGSYGLIALMILSSLASVIAIVGGIANWMDYRREEMAIEIDAGLPPREGPSLRNALRWYETYIATGILIYAALYVVLILIWVIPLFNQLPKK
jgi:hypothetical protein